ncbi:MAG TPA: universal stress protein [Candidatus Sulfomarinibacteraceae bacterium]|nr:universal stress protein [Candidatus Sulfomarinibacteraceae bacterium]
MLPIKRILVPTDFSENSHPAFDAAVELARHHGARIDVIHAVLPITVAAPVGSADLPVNLDVYREAVLEDAREALSRLVEGRKPADLDLHSEVVWGQPAKAIVDFADDNGADLIVIGTRGATGLSRFVTGSVTEKVVRLAEVPVLTIQSAGEG